MKQKAFAVSVVLLLVTLILSTGFGIYLSLQQVTDPFLYYDVSFLKTVLQETQMTIPETGPFSSLSLAPGRQMLMVQFASMMGVEPEVLQFLPLGAVLLSLPLYVLGLRLLKSPLAACLVTLYLTLNLSHAAGLYSIFAYAFALPLFLGLLIISSRLLERRGPYEILLALLLFSAAHLVHYTMTAWMMTFLLGANLAIWLQKRLASKSVAPRVVPVYYLLVSFVVIYFFFNQVLYKSFLPLIGPQALEGAVQRLFSYISLTPTTTSPYYFGRSSSVGLVTMFTLLIILIPVAIGMLWDVWQLLVKRSPAHIRDRQLPIRWGLFLMGIADSLTYTIRGAVSTKSFSMIFPLLMLSYVAQVGRRALLPGMASLLLLTSLLKVAVFYENSYVIGADSAGSSSASVRPGATWIRDHAPWQEYTVLADLNLYGKYLLALPEYGRAPSLMGFDLHQFEQVIGASTEEWIIRPHAVAIDRTSSESTMGFVFERLNPLGLYAAEILDNEKVDLIYDDGAIWLGRPIGE